MQGVCSGGDGFSELDVEVLRIVAFHERWQCLGEDGCAVDFAADANAPLSEAPRIAPPALRGDWKVFDVSAVPIEETDVETGAHVRRAHVAVHPLHRKFIPWCWMHGSGV